VFTIADFDNNSNFKYVRGQSIPAPAHPAPIRSLCGRAGPPRPHQVPAEVEAVVCELRRSHPRWGPARLAFELGKREVAPVPSD
jgi:hypothetical protein